MGEYRFAGVSLPRCPALLPPALASVIVALTLLASGCGDPSPEARFFDQVCSTTLPQAKEMVETYEEVRLTRAAPGLGARAELLALTVRGAEVARKFRAERKALRTLDTDAGRNAERFLDLSADTAFEIMAEEELQVRRLPLGITLLQSILGLEQLEHALLLTFAEMTAAGAIAAQADMLEHFEKADSCEELEAVGAD